MIATVIGAGVVGLSIAARLSKRFTVIVLDKHKYIANETSSRNSEVIHAGIYYPPTSLKTKHCVAGKHMLYDTLQSNHSNSNRIPFKQCGKVIVATSVDGLAKLEQIKLHASSVGVDDLRFLSQAELHMKVPIIKGGAGGVLGALYSPTSGIFDSHAFIRSLESEVLSNGGIIQLRHDVTAVNRVDGKYKRYLLKVQPETDCEPFEFESDVVVNAAGLYADDVYAMIENDSQLVNERRVFPCRGHYYTLNLPQSAWRGGHRLDTLVYPVPDPNLKGLGIHLTIDLAGRIRVGPDAEYIDCKSNYRLDETAERFDKFWRAICGYLDLEQYEPIKHRILRIDYVGIRPKLSSSHDPAFRDFIIEMAPKHDSFVNCIGIESPGLTACLSIAKEVDQML